MRIKQNIFKNTGGIKLICQLLEKGLIVIDSQLEEDESTHNNSYNSEMQEIFDKIINIIKLCYSILISLCENNKDNQQ